MKILSLAWVPFAVLLGMALGSWPARREIDRLRVETEELRKEVRRRQRDVGTFAQLTQMVRLSDPSADAGRAGRTNPPPAAADAAAPATNRPARRRGPPLSELRPRPDDDRPLRARIDDAMEAWRVRTDIARNNFIERAGFDAEQAARFDTLVGAMNVRLRDRLERFAQAVQAGEAVTPEIGARLINDLSAAVVITYDEMDRNLPQWRRPEAGRLDLGNFIDPSVAEPLIGIEDALRRAERERAQ